MPSLSRTAARRQAHRESRIYRWQFLGPKRWTWKLVAHTRKDPAPTLFQTHREAAAALAAWRAERVRELMGVTDRNASCAPR